MENRIAAYERLTVFYWWVADNQQFYLSMEKKKALYEETNMPHKAIETEVAILDGKAWYLNEVDGQFIANLEFKCCIFANPNSQFRFAKI